jgi:hypothetical protein
MTRFPFDDDRPSTELFAKFWRWLWFTLFAMAGMAAISILFSYVFPKAPLGLDLAVLGCLSLVPATTLVVALRFMVLADRARSREATGMPGIGGFVERHGLALGLVAVVIVLALTVIVSRLTGH